MLGGKLRPLVWEVMCVVTLDEVKVCLVGPHTIFVDIGIFLCSC